MPIKRPNCCCEGDISEAYPGVVTVRPVVGAPSNHQRVARALRRAALAYTSTVPANDREPDLRTALGE